MTFTRPKDIINYMAQIKDTNVIKTEDVLINPVFFLPPDVIDVRSGTDDEHQEDQVRFDDIVTDDGVSDDTTVPDDFDPADDDSSMDGDAGENDAEELPAPEYMTIIEQKIRIAPDGKAVVDVVIELEDVSSETTEYDVRVTKL